MSMQLQQLVLISIGYKDKNNVEKYKTGTGYFITSNLILTSNHIFPDAPYESIRARIHESKQWIELDTTPSWKSLSLDASLLFSPVKIDNVSVEWQEQPLLENCEWDSTGYPLGSAETSDGSLLYKSNGLSGQLYYAGGGGQLSTKRLDLSVTAAPDDPENWKGISGAPVFVNKKLVGILKNVPANFKERLEGIPSYELLKDAGFRAAIENSRFTIPDTAEWAVLLMAENADEEELLAPVKAALNELFGDAFQLVAVKVTDILSSPGQLLHFVKLVCKAPYIFIDASGFQPGIMLLLGIRAVVRRAVTIVVTTFSINENDLSDLPFNIQEIKLISLSDTTYLTSKDKLKIAIREGMEQSSINPVYLDLPPYDAVRNPVIFDIPAIKEKTLVLCSFKKEYNNFSFLREKLANYVPTETIVRMLDINSPQLVGQSLYEHIRWAKRCIIDWTEWPANVFYELGVRLAASNISPAILLSKKDALQLDDAVAGGPDPVHLQKKMLLQLFEPYQYNFDNKKFPAGIKDYFDYVSGKESVIFSQINLSKIYPDNIYTTAELHFDWTFEAVTNKPHINIRNQIEREIGTDGQAEGKNNILYSTNQGYKKAIQKNVCELWLCAWYYLYNRYSMAEIMSNTEKRKELIALGIPAIAALDLSEEFKTEADKIFDIVEQLQKII